MKDFINDCLLLKASDKVTKVSGFIIWFCSFLILLIVTGVLNF